MSQLAQLLEGSLSATSSLRVECEAQLTQLLRAPGFALQLCEFLFAQDATNAQKQLACLLLKKLVNSYWVAGADHDGDGNDTAHQDGYVVHDDEKRQVKHAIVVAIQERLELFAESKLQTALCLMITAIFERDWPDQWTEILPAVLQLIQGNDKLRIEFAIRFLSLAGGHFSSDSCCDLVALVFPHLQRVYTAGDEFPAGVRSRIVRIVQSNLLMVGMEAQVGNASALQLLHGNVTEWIGLFLQQLAAPVQVVKDYSIKIQILSTLNSFVKEWPKDMTDLLPQIMPQVYALLVSGIEAFECGVVLNAAEEDDGYDSDGEGALIGHSAMVVAALEFVRGTIHAPTKKTRQLVLAGLPDFVYVMIAYMQITVHQMEVWEDDPNKYVADEDDDSLSYNIRNAAIDLLTELEAVLSRKAVVAALSAAQKRLSDDAGNGNWRLHEAALLVVGSLATPTLAALSKNAPEVTQLLNLSAFLQTLFDVMNGSSQEIYLRARALWCASRLAKGMNQDMLNAFLQVAISGLETSQVLPVRMYACRAIGAIVKQDSAKAQLQAASEVIFGRLIHLAERATEETLHIALETLVVVLQDTDNVSVAAANAIVDCFLQHWGQNLNDPLISEFIDGAFGALLELDNVEIIASLHERVLPVLHTMLVQSRADLEAAGNGVNTAGSAITILKTLLRHSFVSSTTGGSGEDVRTRQMGAQVIQLVFEPLMEILHAVEDEKVLNSGAECLKWLVMFAVEPLAAYTCANGSNGIDATMQIAAKLLAPSLHDSCAICVGGLITQILLKLGSALPATTIQSILTAVSARLATAELPSLVQSLCMVFARLVHSHGIEILNVLEQLPAPATASVATPNMLVFVFRTWIEKQSEFYGLYCIKVTTSALMQVAVWNDPRINQITVTGSEIDSGVGSSSSGGIQTRSRAKNTPSSSKKQYAQVHFLTKFFVVVAKTLSQLNDDEDEWESSDDDDEDDDDDDEDAAVSGVTSGATSSIFAPSEQYELLSDRLDDNGGGLDGGVNNDFGGETEEEFEAHFDPINDIELKESIPNALQLLTSNNELLQAVLPELTAGDKELLGAVAAVSS
uniref:Importin N-terminal domain-containing protein n=1 Tax=Globisporangium ultimum (strain ATCC 200006 / CBS 805.95 / DAOM BR144) TaxID=431595 RepID=K3XAZ2_GLOUD